MIQILLEHNKSTINIRIEKYKFNSEITQTLLTFDKILIIIFLII
jgi:hypothetical protein